MGRNAGRLSERQLEVLRWIGDGCPVVDEAVDHRRRITARALARRGLVKVRGHGATWGASITPVGVARLEAPPKPVSDQERVDDLFRRVVAAGGRLEVDDREVVGLYGDGVSRMSERTPDRPKGWRLAMRRHGGYEERRTELNLERFFADDVEEAPVAVPAAVSRYHPTVKAFLAERHHHYVNRRHLARAARILQALVDHAPSRGLRVLAAGQSPRTDRQHLLDRGHWHVVLESSEGAYGLRIAPQWAAAGKPDAPDPSGVGSLELHVEGPGTAYGGDHLRDAKTIPLEAKLPRVFRKIEVHRLESEHREEQRRREAAERQARWETAMVVARARYDEEARWDAFRQRARDWRELAEQRAFVAAMRAALDGYDGPERDALVEHLGFAERRLEASDPVLDPGSILPDVPDPKPGDLEPFLDGWSPHGPEPASPWG